MRPKHLMRIGMVLVVVLAAATFLLRGPLNDFASQHRAFRPLLETKTVEEQIQTYGDEARERLHAMFKEKGFEYPPGKMTVLAFKDKHLLEIYVGKKHGKFKHLHTYPILASSGKLGPKLREGDYQVPEGVYRLESLEPNTPYHLALRLNFPNDFDIERAKDDGRSRLKSNTLIHGANGSVGCLALGDDASEDLFVLANDTANQNIAIIICPVDLRTFAPPPATANDPVWLPKLYTQMKKALEEYPSD